MSTVEQAVARAESVYCAYRNLVGPSGDDEEVMTDLLADLMHFWETLKLNCEVELDFDDILASAEMHYEAETNEED